MSEYTVLIAEDEEIILQSLMRLPRWEELGFSTVIGAKNGQDGLEKIERYHPDLVVTDVKMPFLDGIGMLERSIGALGYKAIIISGYEEFSFAKRAISLGVSEYLLKPIDIDELEEVVRRLLDQLPSAHRQSELGSFPPSAGSRPAPCSISRRCVPRPFITRTFSRCWITLQGTMPSVFLSRSSRSSIIFPVPT